jgi:hypothetical protein
MTTRRQLDKHRQNTNLKTVEPRDLPPSDPLALETRGRHQTHREAPNVEIPGNLPNRPIHNRRLGLPGQTWLVNLARNPTNNHL